MVIENNLTSHRMIAYILTLLKNMFSVLTDDTNPDQANVISGEIDVVSHDYIDIELGVHEPKHYNVFFMDHIVLIPCNPHHHDLLKCELKNLRYLDDLEEDFFVLRIEWRVSGMRKIGWKIKF